LIGFFDQLIDLTVDALKALHQSLNAVGGGGLICQPRGAFEVGHRSAVDVAAEVGEVARVADFGIGAFDAGAAVEQAYVIEAEQTAPLTKATVAVEVFVIDVAFA